VVILGLAQERLGLKAARELHVLGDRASWIWKAAGQALTIDREPGHRPGGIDETVGPSIIPGARTDCVRRARRASRRG
jgi:hypothetical protein